MASPVTAIQGIDDDIEDLRLERSERFWEMIARARQGKPVAIDEMRRQIAQGGRRQKPSQARRRTARRRAT
jgi:hypothetical protein